MAGMRRRGASSPRVFQVINAGGIFPQLEGKYDRTAPCPLTDDLTGGRLAGVKLYTEPTDCEVFVSTQPSDGSPMPANEYTVGNFVSLERRMATEVAGHPQGNASKGAFGPEDDVDKYRIYLTMPMEVITDEATGCTYEKQVKDINDFYQVWTLIQCDDPVVGICDCGGCDECCVPKRTNTRRFMTPFCLGTVGFCQCDGECKCSNALTIDPAYTLNGIYVAACAAPTGQYVTRVAIQGFNCCP